MSGIAGIYNLDGRPVDASMLARMTDVIADRGPDGVGYWIGGPIGFGHRMLCTTPESLKEKQPLTDGGDNLCLTFDGRVDNRDELTKALEANAVRLRDDTDAEIVLRAYECWGEESPKRIIGDFAFAIWDKRHSRLFCARDPIGIKPFYYFASARTFLCGSELRQLFEEAATPRRLNEGMVGEYLAVAITDNEETLYSSLFRLPPGHRLIVEPGRIRKEKYWDIDPSAEIVYRSDSEYSEHFLEIFKEAVRCRLRSQRTVGIYLSGGLDSSSIVSLARSLDRDKRCLPRSGIETFSMRFPDEPHCDEGEYIEDVLRKMGLKNWATHPIDAAAGWYEKQVDRFYDFPDYPNATINESVLSLARGMGIRVMLTGFGGDEWLTGSRSYGADLLRQFRISRWFTETRCELQQRGSAVSDVLSVLRRSFAPLVPARARRSIRSVLKREHPLPLGIEPAFADRIHLTERLRREANWPRFDRLVHRDLYRELAGGSALHGREMQDRLVSSFGIEDRHPLSDQRLIEFAFALPEEQRYRRGQTKVVLREAMRGLLPERVRQRSTKADFSHVFPRALRAQGAARLFDSLRIASLGWVDGEQVPAMYNQMQSLHSRANPGYINYNWPLWMIFGIELWASAALDRKRNLLA
jgi:asparagine synthase (glutamine-hydrolysing)